MAPTSSQLNISEQIIVSRDNARNKITCFSTGNGPKPVVICMPAMGVAAKYYEPFARALCLGGMDVVTADLRGNGSDSVDGRPGP